MARIILINKQGEEIEYASLNEACQLNGATCGYNKASAINFLIKKGFDTSKIDLTSTSNRNGGDIKRRSTIEVLIDKANESNKNKISELTNELSKLVMNCNFETDIEKVKDKQQEIKALQESKPSKQDVINLISKMYDEYIETEAKNKTEPTTEPTTEPKQEELKTKKQAD